MQLTPEQLTGRDESHIEWHDKIGLIPECWRAFEALQARAAEAGFDLQAASGYRSFDRQLMIWNAKAGGERVVHDDDNCPIHMHDLDDVDKVCAILRFSALPGASRHHWGTDLDVFDAAAMPEDYELQLSPEEVAEDGMFGPLHAWLDEIIDAGDAEGFYRPYDIDRGGVAVERWHLSYAPIARRCESLLSDRLLADAISSCELVLADSVLAELPDLFPRYCCPESTSPDASL